MLGLGNGRNRVRILAGQMALLFIQLEESGNISIAYFCLAARWATIICTAAIFAKNVREAINMLIQSARMNNVDATVLNCGNLFLWKRC